MHTLLGLVYDVVRVLTKSNLIVAIHVLAAVKKRVDTEVICLVDAVDVSEDGMMDGMMDNEMDLAGNDDERMENCTADDYLNAAIIANIKALRCYNQYHIRHQKYNHRCLYLSV